MSTDDLKTATKHLRRQLDHGWHVRGVWTYDEGARAWGSPVYFLQPPPRRGGERPGSRAVRLEGALVYAMLKSGELRPSERRDSASSFHLVHAKVTREDRQRLSRREAARERFALFMRERDAARRAARAPEPPTRRAAARRVDRRELAAGQLWRGAGLLPGESYEFVIEGVERKRVTYVLRYAGAARRDREPMRLLSSLRRLSEELGRAGAVLAKAAGRKGAPPLPQTLVA